MPNVRKPKDKELFPPPQGNRSARLRNLVCSGSWVGNNDIVLIYWSPEDGGRWVMWEDPDPLTQAGVLIDNTH